MKPDLLSRILAGLEVILVAPERAKEIAQDLHDEVAEAACEPPLVTTSKPEDFDQLPRHTLAKSLADLRCEMGLKIGQDQLKEVRRLRAIEVAARDYVGAKEDYSETADCATGARKPFRQAVETSYRDLRDLLRLGR